MKHVISTKELARLGTNKIGYMRIMTSEQVLEAFPETLDLRPNAEFWALFGADGEPLALADEPGPIFSTAMDKELRTVSIH
ncbi:MAG: hypothetical protein COB78_12555 [Hyphomicrobiales bacterium]|nr:MAG: hypothetical protein COB78_12555 [Hyphomicrobiales bacterium]